VRTSFVLIDRFADAADFGVEAGVVDVLRITTGDPGSRV
jgi:hypothetical protein